MAQIRLERSLVMVVAFGHAEHLLLSLAAHAGGCKSGRARTQVDHSDESLKVPPDRQPAT